MSKSKSPHGRVVQRRCRGGFERDRSVRSASELTTDWLQWRNLPVLHTGSARVDGAFRRCSGFFVDIDNRAGGRLCTFVLVETVTTLQGIGDLLFEITYSLGQRMLFLQKRRIASLQCHACLLDVNYSVKHGAACFSQPSVVSCVDGDLRQINRCAQCADGRGDGFDHEGSPSVEMGGVGVSDSTARGNGAGEGDHA